jgi:hypothetical protein
MKPLYIFIHIPRTAGVSFIKMLSQLPEEATQRIYMGPHLPSRDKIKEHLSRIPDHRRDELQVVFGHHVFYGIEQFFPNRDCRFITFVRNPVDQIVSFYNNARQLFAQRGADIPNGVFHDGAILPFDDWFLFSKYTRNYNSTFLTQEFLVHPFHGKQQLEELKMVLSTFHFVGLTETFAEDCQRLTKELGIPYEPVVENASKHYFDPTKYRDLVEKFSPVDVELYEFCVELNARFKE